MKLSSSSGHIELSEIEEFCYVKQAQEGIDVTSVLCTYDDFPIQVMLKLKWR